MSNTIINGGASPYPKHVGPAAVCSFSDGAQDAPLKSLKFYIEPSQDLHGYSYPWPGGGGVNKFDGSAVTTTHSSNWEIDWNATTNVLTITQKTSYTTGTPTFSLNLPSGTYVASYQSISETGKISLYTDGSWVKSLNNGVTFTLDSTKTNEIRFAAVTVTKFQIESGSTATAYAPYSNICPISGWTQVDGKQSGEDMTDYTPIAISLGQTVYGGTVDAISGKCYARPYYASYGGQALVGPWISSHDKYVAGGTPTTGAQVVDMGGTETTLSLTPVSVNSLLGQNNIWCNTGETELDYYPAAASVVAVLNRSSKVYTSIPLGKIRYDTYQTTPNQALDLDSYRAETGVLIRNVLSHTATKIEFNTPSMTNLQWEEVWNIIKAGFNNSTERKLKLKYYDQMSATYKTGWFYVPDVQFTIRNIDEANGIINYDEVRVAFIEY